MATEALAFAFLTERFALVFASEAFSEAFALALAFLALLAFAVRLAERAPLARLTFLATFAFSGLRQNCARKGAVDAVAMPPTTVQRTTIRSFDSVTLVFFS